MEAPAALDRQLRLLRMLTSRQNGMSVDDLIAETGVSTKTIRRDLERLRAVGFPLNAEVETHGRKRWRMAGDSSTGVGLPYDQAFVLLLAAGALRSLAGTALGEALDLATQKLRSGLSETSVRYCDRLAQTFKLVERASVDYHEHGEILEQILLGHEERKNVFITYHSRRSTEPTSYPISPYAIRLYRDVLYVIAYSEMHDEVRTFKVDRISDAEITQFPFHIRENFDADQHLVSAMGIFTGQQTHRIMIRFAPRAARPLSETRWHPSQQLEQQPDGSTIATYEVAITPELIGWVLSIGRDATVIEPPELVERVQVELEATLDHYRQPKAASVASERP
ncbi:MAG: WYL domain-containing protein [Candidatus Paceibacterota bacterium]